MTTAQTIKDTIEANVESTVLPEQLMQLIQEANGKRLTTRLADKWAKQLGATIYIRKQYGMTHLDINEYWRQQYKTVETGKHQFDFLIAHQEVNVYIDAERIRNSNARHLEAANQRNYNRELQLQNQDLINDLAQAIDDYKDAQERLKQLKDRFTDWFRIEANCKIGK